MCLIYSRLGHSTFYQSEKMAFYPVKYQSKYQNTNTNLRLLHLRSKIRRLVLVQEVFEVFFLSNF